VVVAAGYQPDHSWVELPITDGFGAVEQYRGVTRAPGVYVVGQRFQHRRDSGFIDGARHSARDVVAHLTTGALSPAHDRSREGAAA
jgi:putative flavoprotein involved in K+ transport